MKKYYWKNCKSTVRNKNLIRDFIPYQIMLLETIKNITSLLRIETEKPKNRKLQTNPILIVTGSAVLANLFINITLLLTASTFCTRVHCNTESAIYHSCQLGLDLTCEKIVDDMRVAISWLIYD